jgi:hypothetical protein
MLRPQGYATIVGDSTTERDTITCGHCQRIVFVKPNTVATVYLIPQWMGPDKEESGAMCKICMRAICIVCCEEGRCTPFERRIEEMERKRRMIEQVLR